MVLIFCVQSLSTSALGPSHLGCCTLHVLVVAEFGPPQLRFHFQDLRVYMNAGVSDVALYFPTCTPSVLAGQ